MAGDATMLGGREEGRWVREEGGRQGGEMNRVRASEYLGTGRDAGDVAEQTVEGQRAIGGSNLACGDGRMQSPGREYLGTQCVRLHSLRPQGRVKECRGVKGPCGR